MISRILKLCFLLCALTLCLGVRAQGNWVVSQTTFRGRVVDSLTKEPLPGAVVSVVTQHGEGIKTLHNFVTNNKGDFSFSRSIGIQHRMEITSLGYKPYGADLVMGEQEENLGLIRLSQSTLAIDDVVVKGRLQMYKMKGDTVIFLPQSVNTMMDDSALEILRQMPGVEVEGTSVKILGQTVERTYVNQKLLFGDDPAVALQELNAKEVASIEAYDEVDEADAVANGVNARKRKVLNVVTFKEFTQSYSGKARGEMGTDFNKNEEGERPVRYLASGNVNFFSEKLQFGASGQSNNLTASEGGRTSSFTSQRQSNAEANVSGESNDKKHNYKALYSYWEGFEKKRSSSTSDYFPTDYFTSQHNENSNRNKNESSGHSLSGQYNYTGERYWVSSAMDAKISHGSAFDQSRGLVERDDASLSATDITSKRLNNSRSIDWSASGGTRFKDGNSISANARVSLNKRQSRGVRLEQQTTAGVDTLLGWRTFSPTPDNSASGGVSYTLNFDKAGKLSFGTDAKYEGRAERMLYTDIETGERDLVRSEDAFDKTITWGIGPSYSLSRENHYFAADLDYKLENRVYEDAKAGTTDRRNFHSITSYISYRYNKPKKNFSVTFRSGDRSVAGKFFSSRINDSHPLYVSTGNSSLVPEKNYNLEFRSGFVGKGSSSFGFTASLGAVTDPIMYRNQFFKVQTPLSEKYGGYLMAAGSTLTTPENGPAYLQVNAKADYKVRIAPLRLFLDMSGWYSFSNPEGQLYDKQERTARHMVQLTTQITSNFSSQFRIRIKNEAILISLNRFGNTDRDFRDVLEVGVEWDIISKIFVRGDYTGIFSSSSGQFTTPNANLLSLSVGCRVLKNRGHIALNAYDVLNDYSPIRISQTLVGVSRSVEYVGANFFTVSFEYKFNNRRATK